MARRRTWEIILCTFIVVIPVGAIIFFFAVLFRERILERRYQEPIARAAARYRIDPLLVKAVIWQESGFNAQARGKAGEIGLMQIMDLTAEEWAQAEKLKDFKHEHLFEPTRNIHAGAWYLSKLLKRYTNCDNALPYALADYNAGRTHVLRWTKGRAATNSAQFLAQMDFPGTRKYALSVIHRYEYYQRHEGTSWAGK